MGDFIFMKNCCLSLVVAIIICVLCVDHSLAFGISINSNNVTSSTNTSLDILTTVFGKRYVHNGNTVTINNLVGIPLERCKSECYSRTNCSAIEYRVFPKFCTLLAGVGFVQIMPGYVIVSGFDTLVNRSCGASVCHQSESCDVTSGTCSIRECRYPMTPAAVAGNRFDVGSRMVYTPNYYGKPQSIVCTSSGQWLGLVYQGLTCKDIKDNNTSITSGDYRNQLNIRLRCDFDSDGGNWMVFQRRFDGSVDFFRTWEDYKYGFGDWGGEFWAGLEGLHTILKFSGREFELRMDLENWSGTTKYAVYEGFYVENETEGYRLRVGNYSGTAGDDMHHHDEPHDGAMFSTHDRDQDTFDGNCASRYLTGWWLTDCFRTNLNGPYIQGGIATVYATGIIWNPITGFWESLKATTMKAREKN